MVEEKEGWGGVRGQRRGCGKGGSWHILVAGGFVARVAESRVGRQVLGVGVMGGGHELAVGHRALLPRVLGPARRGACLAHHALFLKHHVTERHVTPVTSHRRGARLAHHVLLLNSHVTARHVTTSRHIDVVLDSPITRCF